MRTMVLLCAVGALSTAVVSGPACGQDLSLSGETPLVCGAGIGASDAGVAADNPVSLHEFCNDPDGYDLFVDYPPALAGGALVIDGQTYELTSAGSVRISHADAPRSVTRSLVLKTSLTGPVALTIRVAPTQATQVALGGN